MFFESDSGYGVPMAFSLDFPRAYGEPLGSAHFREALEDFFVDEIFAFESDADGEHHYVQVEKRGENTLWMIDQIANFCGVKPRDVGYCGLKDRHGVTRQWLSVYLPKSDDISWDVFSQQHQNVTVLQTARGRKKIRRGDHQANRFKIRLRRFTDLTSEALDQLMGRIGDVGVPNYFGEQRFGFAGNNLRHAEAWATRSTQGEGKKRRKKPKGMIISAARSYLFNQVLAERVRRNNWHAVIEGDIPVASELDAGLCLPSGPLWGRGRSLATADAGDIETASLEALSSWAHALEHVGLKHERRSLVLKPSDFEWTYEGEELELSFLLSPGQYATAILREIAVLKNMSEPNSE